MLRKLYALQRLTSTRIADALGVEVRYVEGFFRSLKGLGIYLKPDIDHRSLGWKRCVVVLRNVVLDIDRIRGAPFVRSALFAIPLSTVLVIDVSSYEPIDGVEVLCLDFVVRSRPEPELLKEVARGCIDAVARSVPREVPEVATPYTYRIDWIDLEILRIVSRDPTIRLRSLSYALKRSVRSHVNHAEGAISGYRVSRIDALRSNDSCVYIVFATCSDPHEACRRFVAHPFVRGCGYARNTVVLHSVLPMKYLNTFTQTLAAIAPECRIEETFVGPLNQHYVAFVGSTSTGEYSSRNGLLAETPRTVVEKLFEIGALKRIQS